MTRCGSVAAAANSVAESGRTAGAGKNCVSTDAGCTLAVLAGVREGRIKTVRLGIDLGPERKFSLVLIFDSRICAQRCLERPAGCAFAEAAVLQGFASSLNFHRRSFVRRQLFDIIFAFTKNSPPVYNRVSLVLVTRLRLGFIAGTLPRTTLIGAFSLKPDHAHKPIVYRPIASHQRVQRHMARAAEADEFDH